MRGAKISLMVKGRRKVVDIYAPMLGAGIGDIFERTQQSRTYMLHLEPYTAATKPERDYYASDNTADFDRVYAYLRDWAGKVKLNRNPPMTKLLRRAADNARGLLAVADSCGPNWGQQARDALTAFAARDTAAQPHYLIVKHGLIIFDNAGLTEAEDVIETTQFNRELRLLDLPDADWGQYRGAGGMAYPHPITHSEQAKLLRRSPNGIVSKNQWPAGPRVPGTKSKRVYVRAAFEAAMRAHTRHTAPHLRLVT